MREKKILRYGTPKTKAEAEFLKNKTGNETTR
jgi:hypothetical protein